MPSLISEPISPDEFRAGSSRHIQLAGEGAVIIYSNVTSEVLIDYFNTFMQTRQGQPTIVEFESNCDTKPLYDAKTRDGRVHYHIATYNLKNIKRFIGNATGFDMPIRTPRGELPSLHMIIIGPNDRLNGVMSAAVLFHRSPFVYTPERPERITDMRRGLTHTSPINLAFMQVYGYQRNREASETFSDEEENKGLKTINSNVNAGTSCWVAVALKIFCYSVGEQMRLFFEFLDRNVEQYAQVIESMTHEERSDVGRIMSLLAIIGAFEFFVHGIPGGNVRYVDLSQIQDTLITSPAIPLSPQVRQPGIQLDAAETTVNLFSLFRKLYTYLDRAPLNGLAARPLIDVANLNTVEFSVSYRCGNHSPDSRNVCGRTAMDECLKQSNGLKILLSPETETDGLEKILHTTHAFDGGTTCSQCGAPCNIFKLKVKEMPVRSFFCIKLNQPLAELGEGAVRGPAVIYSPCLQGHQQNGRILFGSNICEIVSICCYRQDGVLGEAGHYAGVYRLSNGKLIYLDDFCLPMGVEEGGLRNLSYRANLLVLQVCGHIEQPDPIFEETVKMRQLRIAEEYDRNVVDMNIASIIDMLIIIDRLMTRYRVNRDERIGIQAMEKITAANDRCDAGLHNIEHYVRHTPIELITAEFAEHSRHLIDGFKETLQRHTESMFQ